MNKKIIGFVFSFVFVLLLSATVKAETFFAYLNGAQEVPAASTNATGYARISLNETAGTISFTVVFRNLSSAQQASHIHAPAAIGANTGVIITLGSVGGTSGTITGSAAITPTQIAQLRAHQGYVNVHSVNFPGGEIRGQIGNRRPVDFDGDGRTDYSVLRFPNVAPPGVAPIQFYNLTSTNGFESVAYGNANTDFPAPGDFDGDGEDDYSLYRDGANPGDQSAFFIIKSSDFTLQYYAWGVRGDQAVTRDYDGDGITDVAVFRRGAAQGNQAFWFIRQSATNTARIERFGTTGDTAGGTSGDTPIPGDYDGDGKFDLAVYRFGTIAPTNTYIIRRSSDNAVTYQQFGNFQTDYILPGDYDGDGKFDLAVGRTGAAATSPFQWIVRRSSDNSVTYYTFGISSDLPTQGDYDGDGRTDYSIYRRGATASSQSFFWVRNSLDGSIKPTPWGLQADFPVNTFDAR
ncbi:MAG: CHRD domain-containing protein [Pyrinomonadaceae bacterium]